MRDLKLLHGAVLRCFLAACWFSPLIDVVYMFLVHYEGGDCLVARLLELPQQHGQRPPLLATLILVPLLPGQRPQLLTLTGALGLASSRCHRKTVQESPIRLVNLHGFRALLALNGRFRRHSRVHGWRRVSYRLKSTRINLLKVWRPSMFGWGLGTQAPLGLFPAPLRLTRRCSKPFARTAVFGVVLHHSLSTLQLSALRLAKRWKDWISVSLQEGGGKIYQWLRKEDSLGQAPVVESPVTQLQRISKEWKTIWSKGARCAEAPAPAWPSTPITSDMIRDAAHSFKAHAAVGIDGIRPRRIALLPEEALQTLAVLYTFSEAIGVPLVQGADIVFLPKPTGGERPIGILPTLYRLWCRCRRSRAQAWERANARKYFWASAGRSSSQAVHLQGVRLEEARAQGMHAVALLTDLA